MGQIMAGGNRLACDDKETRKPPKSPEARSATNRVDLISQGDLGDWGQTGRLMACLNKVAPPETDGKARSQGCDCKTPKKGKVVRSDLM